MSLINDAIKRAAASQAPSPPNAGPAVKWQPAEHHQSLRITLGIFLIPLFLGVTLVLGILFIIKGGETDQSEFAQRMLPSPIPVSAREPEVPGTLAPPALPGHEEPLTGSTAPAAGTAPGSISAAGNTPPAMVIPSPQEASTPPPPAAAELSQPDAPRPKPSAPTVPAAPTFPNLKLQGVFYRPSNPSVVINTKTLFKGDLIEEAEVTEITRQSATVVWRGETKVLTLR